MKHADTFLLDRIPCARRCTGKCGDRRRGQVAGELPAAPPVDLLSLPSPDVLSILGDEGLEVVPQRLDLTVDMGCLPDYSDDERYEGAKRDQVRVNPGVDHEKRIRTARRLGGFHHRAFFSSVCHPMMNSAMT